MFRSVLYVILVCCMLTVSGCSLTGYYGHSSTAASGEEINAKNEAKQYLGKSENDVLSIYGEPMSKRYNVYFHDGNTYDEIWYYKYDAGVPIVFPQQYVIQFYFIDGVVKLVTG
ncbi:MAG: hypothetical protein KKD07_03065 [Candidatus Omnitrophica bacterium]|nr:hypothetical protein [Candidatus Omnitrophota bacterium]MBU1997245.1 hypothetical protein [Candidatus Omnitrophota bacterium]MBU4333402.1 hypothetical protein [Candidatus Omnitrophota bacterium]